MVGQPMRKETERTLIVLAVLVLACGACFWIAGELLTYLASGRFSGAGILTAAFIPLRLLFNSSAPMGAWPDDSAPLFATGPFWILSMALIGFAGWLAYRSGPRIGAFMGRGAAPKSAKLAESNDLSALIVRSPQKGRIVLGRAGGKLLAAAVRASVLVFGPTQTGKTTGVAVPTIIEWDGPALITSVKTDLLDDTIAARREMGEVMVFDPAQVVDMHKRSSWTPLARAMTYEGATKTGKALVQSAKQMMGGGKENDFWFMHAQTLMGPLLYAAAVGGRDIGDVVRWLDQQEEDEPTKILMATFDGLDDLPLSALEGIWKMGEQQKDSVYLTALSVVEAYRSPKVLDTARRNEIRPEQLLDGGNHTAYLCAPMHEQEALASLYATLIKQIVDWAYEAYTRTGEPLDPPLLIVLDEAANIAPLSDLNKIASTAAGVGIQLVTIFQDLGQVRERWGHDKAQTIVSNHRATMVLSGIKCEHTLEWVAKVTGDQEVRQLSYTHGHQNKSTTENVQHRRLLPANVVREMKTDTGLLIYGNLPPAHIDLRPWYRDRDLVKRIEGAKKRDPIRRDPITGEIHMPDTGRPKLSPEHERELALVGAAEEGDEADAHAAFQEELPLRHGNDLEAALQDRPDEDTLRRLAKEDPDTFVPDDDEWGGHK